VTALWVCLKKFKTSEMLQESQGECRAFLHLQKVKSRRQCSCGDEGSEETFAFFLALDALLVGEKLCWFDAQQGKFATGGVIHM